MTREGTQGNGLRRLSEIRLSSAPWGLGCVDAGYCAFFCGGGAGRRRVLTRARCWATLAQTSRWRGMSREEVAVAEGVKA